MTTLVKARAYVTNAHKGIVSLDWDCDKRLLATAGSYDPRRIQTKRLRRHFRDHGSTGYVVLTFNMTDSGARMLKKIENVDFEVYKDWKAVPSVEEIIAASDELKGDGPEVIEHDYTTKEVAAPTPKVIKGKDKDLLNGYYIDDETRRVFTTAHKMSTRQPDTAVKVMMVGASGYGKTTVPKLFAQATGMNFYRMNCATVRDPEEWFGYREAVDGSTKFFRSEFAKAIEAGNLVVVLDEFNRLEPWLHNTLFPLLDDDGKTVVHDEEFSIGPNVIVVGTINSGYKYTGTFELDEALLNRFEFIIEVGPMPKNKEVKVLKQRTGLDSERAKLIVKAASDLRRLDVVCSTRTTLLVSGMVVAGLTVREAYQNSVVNRIPNDESAYTLRKDVIDSLNMNCGTMEDRTLTEDVFAKTPPVVEEPVVAEPVQSLTFTIEPKGTGATVEYIKLAKVLKTLGATNDSNHTSIVPLKDAADMAKEVQAGGIIKVTVPADGHYVSTPDSLKNIVVDLQACGVTGRCQRS
jgi:hypothetical protein